MDQDVPQEAKVMKNSLVNIEKRQKEILELLQQTEQLSTFELAESLDVSISTIRRDLNLLEEKNEIIRNYGYCSYNYKNQTDLINLVLKGLNKRLPEKLVNTLTIMIRCLSILARLR